MTDQGIILNINPKGGNGKFKCLHIEIKTRNEEYEISVRGSLHKFSHGNNTGHFTHTEAVMAIKEICSSLRLNPDNCILNYIEVGANVICDWITVPVYQYLKKSLISHKKKYKSIDTKNIGVKGYSVQHENYELKLYDKGPSLLRYEMVFNKKMLVKSFGCHTLSDLANPYTASALAGRMLIEYDEVIMFDDINTLKYKQYGMPQEDAIKLRNISSPKYSLDYDELIKEASPKEKNRMRQEYYRTKSYCLTLVEKYGDGTTAKVKQSLSNQVEAFKKQCLEASATQECHEFPINKAQENVTKGINDEVSVTVTVQLHPIQIIRSLTTSKKRIQQVRDAEAKGRLNQFMKLLKDTLQQLGIT